MQFEEGDDGSRICDAVLAAKMCELLQVSKEAFTNTFQYRTMEDPFSKKMINMPQDPASSSNTRHAMAKHLYSRLFDWLVWRINQSTAGKGGGPKKDATKKIGILDIYGFEVFEWNSFEQLCINFANEKLQQHFNSHMFTLEQRLYAEEGISWSHIQWQDNQEIIDNLEKRPLGVFCILDSECLMPSSTDQTCLSKIYNTFKNSKVVYKPSRFASTNFAVQHYAGEVVYDVLSFLEKNTDKLHADIITLLKSSSMAMCRTLFSDPRFTPDMQGQPSAGRAGPSPTKRAPEPNQRAKQNVTVSMMFRQQLDQLVEDLNRTNPRYIRCIKPNGHKQAHEMDSLDVQRQLRCAGMLESIRIRRAGYSVRRPFKEFFNRFRILCPHISTGRSLDPDYKELSRKILMEVEAKFEAQKQPLEAKSWQVGRSKVFLKEELQGRLEKTIGEAVKVFVLRIQRRWRGFRAKRRYRAMKAATLQVQAILRTLRDRTLYLAELQKSKASVTLQASLRMLAQRSVFVKRRLQAVRIQSIWRGWSCRRKIGRLKGKLAADRIQKMREDEEKKQAFDEAKKAAQEKAKALEAVQRQLQEERERAERESAQNKKEKERMREAKTEQTRAKELESGQLEQLRKELFEAKKENARLQGQLDTKSSETGAEVSAADFDALRAELQEARREKVRLEVEMTTCKSAEEFTAIADELAQLREECSSLRRAKSSAETQLDQKKSQLASVEEKMSRLEAQTLELQVLKSSNDDLQIQLQRLTSQNQALEQRAQTEGSLRNELRDLKVEKIRLEGDLDTLKLREEAMAAKLKGSDKAGAEVQQLRSRAMAAEAELEQSRHQLEALQQQIERSSREAGSERASSLDQLRSELLARIESKSTSHVSDPSMRPSILPDEDGRKSMLGQREMMERLKQQFNEATREQTEAKDLERLPMGNADRELELEEELRRVRKENVELSIRLSSLEEDLKDKQQESTHLLESSSGLKAELEDLKIQLEQEISSAKRQAARSGELQDQLLAAEAELPNLRRRLTTAEEQLLQAQEEARTSQQRCSQMQDESRLLQQQLHQFQASASACAVREREADDQVRGYKDQLEALQQEMEASRSQSESSQRHLRGECERLKVELAEANSERGKMRGIVDEVLKAQESQDLEKWKVKALHFEKKYADAKKLNEEMTQVMSQMTKEVRERSDGTGDASRQVKELQRQLEAKTQELRGAKQERDEALHKINEMQGSGEFFKDKYRQSQEELKKLREAHSVAAATNDVLKARLQTIDNSNNVPLEPDDRKNVKAGDTEQRSAELEELQSRIQMQDVNKTRLEADVAKQHEINDCLRALTMLETQHREICEQWCERAGAVMDTGTIRKTDEIKAQVQHVMRKLDDLVRAQK